MAERAHPEQPGFRDESNPYRQAFLWRYGWVAPHCRGKDVLDLPCGMGWGTSLISDCRSLIGVDISREAIAEASERYGSSDAVFAVGDMGGLGFASATFDVVVCLEGIEHVPESTALDFIAEAARILRHRGSLFLSSPHCLSRAHSGNPYHIREYQPSELEAMLTPYFEVLERVVRYVDDLEVTYIHARLAHE